VGHKLPLKRHKFPPKARTYAWKANLGFNSGNDARTPKYALHEKDTLPWYEQISLKTMGLVMKQIPSLG